MLKNRPGNLRICEFFTLTSYFDLYLCLYATYTYGVPLDREFNVEQHTLKRPLLIKNNNTF